MVRSLMRMAACIAMASVASLATPNAAPAQTAAPTEAHYDTAIKAVYGSQYPITGKLDLQFFPGGHLRGYYHTTYYKLYIDVVGGRDGNYIWLDIGPSSVDLGLGAGPEGKLHVVATVDNDGSFRGQVYPQSAAVISGLSMQLQQVNPQPTGANDQYIFSATPVSGSAAMPPP